MADAVFPGSHAAITYASPWPDSVQLVAVPAKSTVPAGTYAQQSYDGNTVVFGWGPLSSGVYRLLVARGEATTEETYEVATKLTKRVGAGSFTAILTLWVFGGVVVGGANAPTLSNFSSQNGALYAATTAVSGALRYLVGVSPGSLGEMLARLETAMAAAAISSNPASSTVSEATSLLIGSLGFSLA
jgi:hypothetical protein